MAGLICEENVLVRLPLEGTKIVRLEKGRTVLLGKFGSFLSDDVLGYVHGTCFEITELGCVPVALLVPSGTEVYEHSETNVGLNDDGAAQTLSKEAIEALKAAGGDVVAQVVAAHGAFDKKTKFSQEKYLVRKQKKYTRRFVVEYVSSLVLLQTIRGKDPLRVLDMGDESLAMVVSSANVQAGGRYLVVDETGGVVVHAMLERMGGEGEVLVVHENEVPNLVALRGTRWEESAAVALLLWLQFVEQEVAEFKQQEESVVAAMLEAKRVQHERRQKHAAVAQAAVASAARGGFDGLVVATTLALTQVLDRLVGAVGGSRPVVAYSQHKEVLVEACHWLAKDRRVLAPAVWETRVRPYQTIPGRMHPVMSMRQAGGYVMMGTRVFPKESVQAVGRGVVRKRQRREEAAVAAAGEAAVADETSAVLSTDGAEPSVEPE